MASQGRTPTIDRARGHSYRHAMDPAAFGPSIAILVVLVFMLWFALGTQRNIRLGNGILEWLQDGLPLLGRRTTLRWLGSSAVQLDLIEPLQPFREVSVVVVLEPRDVAFLWAFARSRRRRDFLILRASIRRPPMFTIDVGSRDGWTGSVDRVDGGRPLDWPSEGAVGFASPDADEASGRDAWHKL